MSGFVRVFYSYSSFGRPAVLLAMLLLLTVAPSDSEAGLAGPLEPAQEIFNAPPHQNHVAARQAVSVSTMAVHKGSGVRQRLLRPVSLGYHETGLPDFSNIPDVATKKVEFFAYLKPMVEEENQRLANIRRRLGFIQDHIRFQREIDGEDSLWLTQVVKKFRSPVTELNDPEFWPELYRRVDVLPLNLVLVQAANESAWGTSRFAREGNNLFGQWCFSPGCGMVPAGRPAGATYEVASFDSISDSIKSYMRNLNTGRVYEKLRVLRAESRAAGQPADAAELAKGLTSYSERGMAYVTEIRSMIRHNATVIAQLDNH